MANRNNHFYVGGESLSTTLQRIKIADAGDLGQLELKRVNLQFSSIVTAANVAKMTFSTTDNDRDYVLPSTVTTTIEIDADVAGNGSISIGVERGDMVLQDSDGATLPLYLGLALDAGTADLDSVELVYEQ